MSVFRVMPIRGSGKLSRSGNTNGDTFGFDLSRLFRETLTALMEAYSARRLANSASKLGSGFRLRDEILGGFPIFRNGGNSNTCPTQDQKEFSIRILESQDCNFPLQRFAALDWGISFQTSGF
jgi:hypothetical protein